MKTFTITASGKSLSDVCEAIEEALRRIQNDNWSGFDTNEFGSFTFDSEGEFEDEVETESA